MRKLILGIIPFIFLFSQTISPQYGQIDPRKSDKQIENESQEYLVPASKVPLEHTVDPEIYVLGPGDVIGIDVIFTSHMFFTIAVSPIGDVLIPSVGTLKLDGVTMSEAIVRIKNLILDQYKNSRVHVSLLEVRSFLVPITGAVYEPGHYQVFATQRLWTILKNAKGIHPYADIDKIRVSHLNGEKQNISLGKYFMEGNEMNNPVLIDGDKVHIPFKDGISTVSIVQSRVEEEVVWVTGFVEYPGTFKYIPGYTIRDYIALAGGSLKQGSENRAFIERDGDKLPDDHIRNGDQIIVPESIRSKIFGNASTLQAFASFASLYLTYIAATK